MCQGLCWSVAELELGRRGQVLMSWRGRPCEARLEIQTLLRARESPKGQQGLVGILRGVVRA